MQVDACFAPRGIVLFEENAHVALYIVIFVYKTQAVSFLPI